ncbi:hypothetical protein CDAR_167941 [Caerostris darwini]|uniref:Uncharacterized protein n=1 Tax=Caerostris darwini TaxID=1538125 RepID=A0AAV4VKY5_9ARAC|nr:hypothetical protein CDAR_167941 [Caerostris darwini]
MQSVEQMDLVSSNYYQKMDAFARDFRSASMEPFDRRNRKKRLRRKKGKFSLQMIADIDHKYGSSIEEFKMQSVERMDLVSSNYCQKMEAFARDLRSALDAPFDRRNRKKRLGRKKGKFSLQMKSTELPEGYNVAKHILKNNPIQKRKEMFTKKKLEKKLKCIGSDSDKLLPFKKNVCRFFTPFSTVDKYSTLSGSDAKKEREIPPFYKASPSSGNGSSVTTEQFPDQKLLKRSTENGRTFKVAEYIHSVQTDNYKISRGRLFVREPRAVQATLKI